MEMIKLLPGELISKYGVQLKYVLLVCNECERSWGVNIIDNELRPTQLLCQRCSVEKVAKEIQ